MWSSLVSVLLLSFFVESVTLQSRGGPRPHGWNLKQFNSLVAFGDRLDPADNWTTYSLDLLTGGAVLLESFSTPGGGRTWVRYVVQYTGKEVGSQFVPQLNLYDSAVSGAVCSNLISPRTFTSINANFPSVLEYEIPAFMADKTAANNHTGAPYFTPALTATDAVYVMWIGTNDVGVYAFLTDGQLPGKTLTDYFNCVFQALDELYASGGRYFVLPNLAPLNLAPFYANTTDNGVGPNHYWPDKPSNITAISEQMNEYVTTLNNVYKYQTPYETLVAQRYPGANFALFDVYSLISDIYNDPTAYLNGTAPANVTGFEHHGNLNGTVCTNFEGNSPDSFLWYDELHPSEQTDRIIAKNFVDILSGRSKYPKYY